MPFTTLADAIAASRTSTMDQVYANYNTALTKSLSNLSNEDAADPSINFPLALSLDDSYIEQIKSELTDAGWFRVSINRDRTGGHSEVYQVKAYKKETPPGFTAQPLPADQADEEDGTLPPGEVGGPSTASTTAEPDTQASVASTQAEPTAEAPASTEPAAEPATSTEAAPAAEEPAAAEAEPAASTEATPAAEEPAASTTEGTDGAASEPAASDSSATDSDAAPAKNPLL